MNYLLIGNSAAAVGCIEGIRRQDREGKITVLSDEPYHTYSRPLISYLLCGKTDLERMKYRPDTFYTANGCELKYGRAVKLLPDKKQVELENGEKLPYDKLLIATGSRPFVPPISGLDSVPEKFTFMSLDDAKALDAALSPTKRVFIMGAGLIGLKCAEGIAQKSESVVVADLADHILPSILDADGAALVQKHLEKQNISFLLSDGVERFENKSAFLKSGKKVDFDLLVIAVGVRPNTDLAFEAGAEVTRGIVTDEYCRTTLPDIYAAGDCTVSRDASTGESKVLALLPNAYMQGECAGISMAGGESVYDKAIPMNAIGFFGLHILTAGNYVGQEKVMQTGNNYKKLVTDEDHLKGYILIGDVARAGIYTSLIRNQTPLSGLDFELISEKPQLMAFSRSERSRMLSMAQADK